MRTCREYAHVEGVSTHIRTFVMKVLCMCTLHTRAHAHMRNVLLLKGRGRESVDNSERQCLWISTRESNEMVTKYPEGKDSVFVDLYRHLMWGYPRVTPSLKMEISKKNPPIRARSLNTHLQWGHEQL